MIKLIKRIWNSLPATDFIMRPEDHCRECYLYYFNQESMENSNENRPQATRKRRAGVGVGNPDKLYNKKQNIAPSPIEESDMVFTSDGIFIKKKGELVRIGGWKETTSGRP